MDFERKSFTATPELKQDEPGTVRLVFATLNIIDADEDVTRPGAFGEQTVRMQGHGHNTRDLMVGKGRVHEDGDKAVCEHKINLNMQAGKETYESLRFDMENGDPLQEWSYVFDVLKSSNGEFQGRQVRFLDQMRVHSVDPVFLGSGIDTETVTVKDRSDKLAFTGAHRTSRADRGAAWSAPSLSDFTDEGWDDLPREQRSRIAQHFVGSRTALPPERYGDLFGPHHQAGKSGVGSVVWRAISSGRLFQLSSTITGNPGFRRHIGGHYRQFGESPPWEEERGLPFDERFEEAEHALCDVVDFIGSTEKLVASLREQGEQVTERKRAYLDSLLAGLAEAHEHLGTLLKEPEATKPPNRTAMRLRFSELERARRELATSTV